MYPIVCLLSTLPEEQENSSFKSTVAIEKGQLFVNNSSSHSMATPNSPKLKSFSDGIQRECDGRLTHHTHHD